MISRRYYTKRKAQKTTYSATFYVRKREIKHEDTQER